MSPQTLSAKALESLHMCERGDTGNARQMTNQMCARLSNAGLIDFDLGRFAYVLTHAGAEALALSEGKTMTTKYMQGVCGCGAVGIVYEMTETLWVEFFKVAGYVKPETVAGCSLCRVDWAAYAGPLRPVAVQL
jgi:hypothetical protein